MSQSAAKRENFSWTDDEAELLLNIALEYKTEKMSESLDWESIRNKYGDIRDRIAEYLTRIADGEITGYGKDFPHRPEEITKAIVTSKLKGIKAKYRQAVDSGRKSGHGRVVMLYFDLCQEIWGGSPATEQITCGIETTDLVMGPQNDDESAVGTNNDDGNTAQSIQTTNQVGAVIPESQNTTHESGDLESAPNEDEPSNGTTSTSDREKGRGKTRKLLRSAPNEDEPATSTSTSDKEKERGKTSNVKVLQSDSTPNEDEPATSTSTSDREKERGKTRKLLDDKLMNYKQKNLRKRLPSDTAAEELELKKKMMHQMDCMDKSFHENMSKLSGTMDKLSGAIISGFSILKDLLERPQVQQPPNPGYRSHLHQPYPTPPGPIGHPLSPHDSFQYGSRSSRPSTPSTDSNWQPLRSPVTRPSTPSDPDQDNNPPGHYHHLYDF